MTNLIIWAIVDEIDNTSIILSYLIIWSRLAVYVGMYELISWVYGEAMRKLNNEEFRHLQSFLMMYGELDYDSEAEFRGVFKKYAEQHGIGEPEDRDQIISTVIKNMKWKSWEA